MSKSQTLKREKQAVEIRRKFKQYYLDKYFNKFLNRFDFHDTLDYQQIAYMLRKLWAYGTIGAFARKLYDEERPSDKIVFAPWVLNGVFNNYDFPTGLTFVNPRNVSFIPSTPFDIDVEGGACIGFIQRNKKGVITNIETLIEKIVDIEMTIRTNLKAQKTPWLFGVSPENEDKIKNLSDNIDSDNPSLFVSMEDLQSAKALVSGATYNIDKLEMLRQQVENEILTRLGISNIGVLEKKEHFTVGEVKANNDLIESSGDEYLTCLQEFFARIEKYLGYRIEVSLKETEIESEEQVNASNKEDEEDE